VGRLVSGGYVATTVGIESYHSNLVLSIDWVTATASAKRAHVEVLLESLEHKDADLRLANIRKLLYIIQGARIKIEACIRRVTSAAWDAGTFAESTSPEHHLHMIIENCKIVRAANGFSDVVNALKLCNAKHDLVW
jgi:hypothetical protein